jgi:hypothetical protein
MINMFKSQLNKVEFLTHPDEFFSPKSKEAVRWKTPLLIMSILGAIIAIGAAYGAFKILPSFFRTDLPPSIFAIPGAVAGFLGTLVVWWIAGALLYVISLIFKKGEGELSKTVEFISYGAFPLIFAGIINIPIFFHVLSTSNIYQYLEEEALPSLTNFPALLEYIKPMAKEIIMRPSVAAMAIIGLLFTYWCIYLWIFGIKNARNLSFKEMLLLFLLMVGIITVLAGGVIAAII